MKNVNPLFQKNTEKYWKTVFSFIVFAKKQNFPLDFSTEM